jgi:nitroreductase
MSIYSNDFNHVMTTTRSVRRRLDFDRQIDFVVIEECMNIALQAPTGGHAEDWRWIFISDVEVKSKIAKIYRDSFIQYVKEPLESKGSEHSEIQGRLGGVSSAGLDNRTTRMLDGASFLADNIGRSQYMLLACATRPNPQFGGAGSLSALYGSVYPAIWSFQLALRSRGLGSVITTLHLHAEKEVAEILGIPDHATQVALLPIGHTIGTEFKVAERNSIESVAFLNSWNSPLSLDN